MLVVVCRKDNNCYLSTHALIRCTVLVAILTIICYPLQLYVRCLAYLSEPVTNFAHLSNNNKLSGHRQGHPSCMVLHFYILVRQLVDSLISVFLFASLAHSACTFSSLLLIFNAFAYTFVVLLKYVGNWIASLFYLV